LSGFGAKAYSKLGLETDVINAEPHRLVLMLFDGALLCIRRAKVFLAERHIAAKCQALSQACEIVDSGLRVSVDPSYDPEFAGRLISLYRYVTMRLLQANLRNDVNALDEAAKILGDLRGAWIQIAPRSAAATAAAAPTAGDAVTTSLSPARRAVNAYQV
jgi:flagellar protein FliS